MRRDGALDGQKGRDREEGACIDTILQICDFSATESNKSYVRDMMHEVGEAARSSSTLLEVWMWAGRWALEFKREDAARPFHCTMVGGEEEEWRPWEWWSTPLLRACARVDFSVRSGEGE